MNPNHSEIYFRTILKHLFSSQYLIIGNSNIGANPSKGFGNDSIRMNPNHSEIYFQTILKHSEPIRKTF